MQKNLARYDGIHFKMFQHNSKDSTTLSSNLIVALKMDKRNRIWVEHEFNQIDCFDPVTETVKRITSRPLFNSHPFEMLRRSWLPDTAGNLWCAQRGKGLYLYNLKTDSFTQFTKASGQLTNDSIIGLLEDRHYKIWVASNLSISLFEPLHEVLNIFISPLR